MNKISRREFAIAGAAVSAACWTGLAAQGPPSDRVRLGFIGVGVRGSELLGAFQRVQGTQVVAIADLYDGCLEHAKELAGGSVEVTKDYRRILDRKDIDAIVVATPDHWHAALMTEAAKAGKDIYAEKPVVHKWEEGVPLLRALRESKRVVQVGSGRIGLPVYQQAKEIVQSGRLGKITLVTTCWDSAGSIYAWQMPIPPDASPDTADWKAFLGPAPERPFDLKRFFRWRCYWDYGGGLPADLFSHHLTAIHWIMDAKMPKSAVCHGGIYRWKDGREVPDTVNAVYEYPEGFAVLCSSTKNSSSRKEQFEFLGTEATLVLAGNELTLHDETGDEAYSYAMNAWPKKARDQFYVVHGQDQTGQPRNSQRLRPETERLTATSRPLLSTAHQANFIQCVRSRQTPWETADMGVRAAWGACMANLAFQQKSMVTWDETQQRPV